MGTLTDAVNTLVTNTTTLQTTVTGRITDMDGKIASADTAKVAAEAAKAGAEVAKSLADTAKTDAETAQTLAQSAKDSAETAQGIAATAKTDALLAKAATDTAKGNAVAAQAAAESARGNAEDWASKTSGAVSGGEMSAKYHAQTASTDAGTATTKAAAALASANAASTNATTAANAVLSDRYTKAETDAKIVALSPPTDISGKFDKSGGTINGGVDTTVDVRCTNNGRALIRAGLSTDGTQATGAFEITQEGVHGGGVSYNGDGAPVFVNGEIADWVTFYAMTAGIRTKVFSYPHNSTGQVTFNGAVTATGFNGDGSGLTGTSPTVYQAQTSSTAAISVNALFLTLNFTLPATTNLVVWGHVSTRNSHHTYYEAQLDGVNLAQLAVKDQQGGDWRNSNDFVVHVPNCAAGSHSITFKNTGGSTATLADGGRPTCTLVAMEVS